MTDIPTCAWFSVHNCDLSQPLEEHRVQVGNGPLRIVLLCHFHGQYWPKVGEDQEVYLRRTQRARSQMASPERRRIAAERKARQRASAQRGRSQRQTDDVELPEDDDA